MSKNLPEATARQGRREFLKAGGAITAALLAPAALAETAKTMPALPSNPRTPAAMPTRNLGKTGYRVGIFSLGGQAAIEHPNNFDVAVPIIERALDLGFVGEPAAIDVRVIHALTGGGLVPVIAPVGVDAEGQTYNINADTVASAIAGALHAERLLMLTDVPGVLDKQKNLIDTLTLNEVRERIEDGTITDGMIPKVECCVDAVRQGVRGAVILDGRVPHACLLELFTEAGPGTLVRR